MEQLPIKNSVYFTNYRKFVIFFMKLMIFMGYFFSFREIALKLYFIHENFETINRENFQLTNIYNRQQIRRQLDRGCVILSKIGGGQYLIFRRHSILNPLSYGNLKQVRGSPFSKEKKYINLLVYGYKHFCQNRIFNKHFIQNNESLKINS